MIDHRSNASPLHRAAAAWAKKPAKHRKAVVGYFIDEAKQSIDWAQEENERGDFDEANQWRGEARALRAAIALLRTADKLAKKRKVGRRR